MAEPLLPCEAGHQRPVPGELLRGCFGPVEDGRGAVGRCRLGVGAGQHPAALIGDEIDDRWINQPRPA